MNRQIEINLNTAEDVIHIHDLWQWDQGMEMLLTNMQEHETAEVHFSLTNGYGTAEVLPVTASCQIKIPAFIFENRYEDAIIFGDEYLAYAYVYIKSEQREVTVKKIIFHIRVRARPNNYIYEEEEKRTWEQLEERLTEVEDHYIKDTDYATTEQAGIVKIHNGNGVRMDNNHNLLIDTPNETDIKNKTAVHAPLKPNMIDKIVKYGLTDNQLEWTDEEKKAVAGLIGVRAALADTLVRRYSSGGIQVPEVPTDDTHAASKKYVDEKIFMAEYGVTTYDELATAYKAGREIILHVPTNSVYTSKPIHHLYVPMIALDHGIEEWNFLFECVEYEINYSNHWVLAMTVAKREWECSLCNELVGRGEFDIEVRNRQQDVLNEHTARVTADQDLKKEMEEADDDLSTRIKTLQDNLNPLLTTAFNSFRGGFRDEAGVLNVNAPGIYMVMQAGSGNKNIIIKQKGTEVLNEKWNGVIVLSADNGVITPVGIKSGLTQWATPGTYQGWLKDSTDYITTISYPKEAVVWYMGNSQVTI